MRKPRPEALADLAPMVPLPGWIVNAPAETLEGAAFRSGAALAHLLQVTAARDVPQALWRDRLALSAAATCAALTGRREEAGALRDAVYLLRPGDYAGPGGVILQHWSRAVGRPLSVGNLSKALDGISAERIALCLDAGGGTPVERAAAVIEAVLTDSPRAETVALILADAVLSAGLGGDHIVPCLSLTLKPRDLALREDALRLACHRAVVCGVGQAVPVAADLARRAARLQAVAPKLRAKGAGRAVDLFLSRDVLVPGVLSFMSDRAARRLCDRLVDLGVVREMTGRDSFRLYGV